MSIAAGSLSRKLAILRPIDGALDPLGMPITGPAGVELFLTLWGNPKSQTGMGVIGSTEGVDTALNAYSWRVRYNPTIQRNMTVVEIDTAEIFNIVDVRHDRDRHEWTDLVCQIGAQ